MCDIYPHSTAKDYELIGPIEEELLIPRQFFKKAYDSFVSLLSAHQFE